MQLIGEAIRHQVYGKGIVTDWDKGMVTVCFSGLEKKFIYPDAFSKYLILKNTEKQKSILEDLDEQEKEAEQKRKARDRADAHRAFLRTMKISSVSQAVFNIKPEDIENVCSQWQVSTGTYISGYSKGEPRVPEKMNPNSACVLTVRPKGQPESQRKIVGLFMVKDTFLGKDCQDGLISAHSTYRLQLAPAEQRLFWPYVTQDPKKQRWGNTAFKYQPNTLVEQLLFDLKQAAKDDPDREDFLERFHDYFCRLNRLEPVHAAPSTTV